MNGEPTVVGNPVNSVNPSLNGEPTVVDNPVLQQTTHDCTPKAKIYTSTPRHSVTKGRTVTVNDESGKPVRITRVTISLPPKDISIVDPDKTLPYGREDGNGSVCTDNRETEQQLHSSNASDNNMLFNDSSSDISDQTVDNTVQSDDSLTSDGSVGSMESIPVPSTAKPLPQGRWLTKDELYDQIINPVDMNEDVPPGDKTNSYLLVNNDRKQQKCDFYDDCGMWNYKKGNSCKTTYVVTNGYLRHVGLKNNKGSTKVRRQGNVHWVPIEPQPASEDVVTISRYYATHKTDPSFEKKVSYFVGRQTIGLGT